MDHHAGAMRVPTDQTPVMKVTGKRQSIGMMLAVTDQQVGLRALEPDRAGTAWSM